jgi:hypothetical protein
VIARLVSTDFVGLPFLTYRDFVLRIH